MEINPHRHQSEVIRESLDSLSDAMARVKTPEDVALIVDTVMESDYFAQSLLDRIQIARANGNLDAEKELVNQRAKMYHDLEVTVALETGVEIEPVEHAKQNKEYREKIEIIVNSIDPESSDQDVMEKLGILTPVVGPAEYRFTFPSSIFPPYVREQWDSYMVMVEHFEIASAKLKNGMLTQTDFNGVNLARGNAHNTVSNSISEVLQFPGWELEDYRNFVAKMRDHKYATSMGELGRYSAAFASRYRDSDIQLHLLSEDLTDINRAILNHKE